MIIGCSNSVELAKRIAKHSGQPFAELIVKHFPDGELYIRYPIDVKGKHIVLVQSMNPKPNDAMMEAMLAERTAKELGASTVTLIAPYLAYLRQDKRFHPGECKSNNIIASMLKHFSRIITIDPHLHRIRSLGEIFNTRTATLSANELISDYIGKHWKNPAILGPDIESFQWAETIAAKLNLHALVLKKKRYTSRTVRIKLKEASGFKGKDVVIVDDIISTGHTMLEVVKQLRKHGAKSVTCICVHGVFAEQAAEKLRKAGAKVISTNTIVHQTNAIDVSKIISEAL